MDDNFNFDGPEMGLSSAARQAGNPNDPVRGGRRPSPVTRQRSLLTAPGTRRGSLMPVADAYPPSAASGGRRHRLHELNLFHFDLRELVKDMLLAEGGESKVSYHEYAVFSPPEGDAVAQPKTASTMTEGQEALQMFRDAVRYGYGLDNERNFVPAPKGNVQGRVRQVIAHRRPRPNTGHFSTTPDGVFLTVEDYESLGLHAGTLSSMQRITVESLFWNPRRDMLYIVLSFSANPQPPYDFLSMAYNLRDRTTTALIRRSVDTRWHDEEALDEYENRLDACRARWAHPLVLPVVLLQVQLLRTEEEVVSNNDEVCALEAHVNNLIGNQGRQFRKRSSSRNGERPFGPLKRLSTFKNMVEKVGRRNSDNSPTNNERELDDDYVPPQTIHLMKEAHDVLKEAIQLLDTLRWMERAVKLLIQAGDELEVRLKKMQQAEQGQDESKDQEDDHFDVLGYHWHEVRQYLDCTWRLCTSLETDRRMSELRCRAQIDIIYSKMAQEDNNLNARMAVASTRDSSSMKALAVITAIFLPGEFVSSLFGVSMFDWEKGTAGDAAISEDAPSGWPSPVIMPLFWVYWAFTLPLTIFIVVLWRAWWVNQDRFFRRHLSMELSNERYWTSDGRPRDLETSFLQDFFSLFSRSGGGSTANSTILGSAAGNGNARKSTMSVDSPSPGFLRRGLTLSASDSADKNETTDGEDVDNNGRKTRLRTISFARSLDEPPCAV
ncbi:uncharacterized protein BCR38DRAFT_440227 [Pseudomassariella vexata]|uniref:Uncharacterized protein n=1 Tax=Pseudomassariella vexata TaxID=1141098 RepID=A0A1Y2DQ73_9PEZI|nr:uncharacterized protein BCR38DRAFT_440227 [Pseudomassariella vexata]ORY61443.1 hypothetical protein BCR38DRAFT_440227 [Pseudomassariella vexata]